MALQLGYKRLPVAASQDARLRLYLLSGQGAARPLPHTLSVTRLSVRSDAARPRMPAFQRMGNHIWRLRPSPSVMWSKNDHCPARMRNQGDLQIAAVGTPVKGIHSAVVWERRAASRWTKPRVPAAVGPVGPSSARLPTTAPCTSRHAHICCKREREGHPTAKTKEPESPAPSPPPAASCASR